MSVNVKFTFDAGFAFLLPHFIEFTQLRNYNNYPYLYVNRKWIHLSVNNYLNLHHHINNFRDHMFDENGDKKIVMKELNYKERSSLSQLLGNITTMRRFVNKMADYVVDNIPNTAINVEEITLRLPPEITNLIFEFASGESDGSFIYTILDRVLLPDAELIQKIASHIPEVLTNTNKAFICLKYVRLYSFNHILHVLRHKFCDEMNEKKSNTKYQLIRKEDDVFFNRKIFFNKKIFSNWGIELSVKYIIEEMFFSEMKDKYNGIYCYEFMNSTFCQREKNIELYCSDWKTHLPELLSHTTKISI
jgi:hypothetical protein